MTAGTYRGKGTLYYNDSKTIQVSYVLERTMSGSHQSFQGILEASDKGAAFWSIFHSSEPAVLELSDGSRERILIDRLDPVGNICHFYSAE